MHGQTGILDEWVKAQIGLRPGETLSQARIREYQLGKLKTLLPHMAAASPFYRRRLAGYNFDHLHSFADLSRLPFTTAADLKNESLQMLCVSQSEIQRVVTLDTSGTTGRPKRVFFTPADQDLTLDYFREGMATLTQPGEKVLILLPGQRPGGMADLLARALRGLGVEPVGFGVGHTLGEILAKLADTGAQTAVGIPTFLLAAAKYHALVGAKPALNLKRLLLTTDYVARALVEEIHRLWGADVYRYFGMTELGMGGGIECGVHDGCHLYEGDFLFEIVDPASGVPSPDGEYGELVVTTLTRRGMPLLRYRTGDLARISRMPCACGSVLARLGPVKARRKDLIRVGEDLTISMGALDELWPALPGVIDCTAVFSHRTRPSVLEIGVRTVEETPGHRRIRDAFRTHPALRLLSERDRLRITAEHVAEPALYRPRPGKRRIIVENMLVKE